MRKKLLLVLCLVFSLTTLFAQQKVKDGTLSGGNLPNKDAIVELESSNKGLLHTRVALRLTTDFFPLTAHVAGMMVFNTATVGDVTPGIYYNDGSKWFKYDKGLDGKSISSGSGVPTGGKSGDSYINTINGDLYTNTGGVWSVIGNIKGPKGDLGATGLTGATGATGPAGAVGPQGPVGNAGAAGLKGDKGDMGTTGLTGATGSQGVKGDKGDVGLAGAVGPQGPVGNAGATGVKGDKGDVGATGLTGATGPAGVKGDKGEIGLTGATGPAGVKGDKGEVGATGSTGATGPAGLKGEIGLTGATGAQGIKGDVGATGLTGATGSTGATGPAGVKGDKGDVGLAGAVGPEGPIGNTGPAGVAGAVGPQGPIGNTGPAGVAGAVGSQGPIGNTGPAGVAGAVGPQGPIGNTGPAGVAGAVGSQGPIGNTGPAGVAGAIGPQGPIGNTGPAGVAGAVGPQGPAGANGTNGVGGVSTAGTGIAISGLGTVADPYIINNTAVNPPSVNIYNADGTLTANRTVTQGVNKITFGGYTGAGTDAFSVAGTTFNVDAVNNRVGINTSAPSSTLHVNGSLSLNIRKRGSGLVADDDHTIICTGGNYLLPTPSIANKGRMYIFLSTDGYPSILVSPINVNGSIIANKDINSSSLVVQSDGSEWYKLY